MKISEIINFGKLKELLKEYEEDKLITNRKSRMIYNKVVEMFGDIRNIKGRMF